MAEPPLYLFDGHNILHAGRMREPGELVDRLASFVALRGARGIVVFDGHGRAVDVGALRVLFALPADRLIERLAAEHRATREVHVVSSDRAVRRTAGFEVRHLSAQALLRELEGDTGQWRRY